MSDEPMLPPSEPETRAEPAAAKPVRRDAVPWLYAVGFLILAVAVFYLWQYPKIPDDTAANTSALHDAEQQIASLDARLNKLEQRPAPDLGKINAHLEALDGRVSDQAQLGSRLDALSGRVEIPFRAESNRTRRQSSADRRVDDAGCRPCLKRRQP